MALGKKQAQEKRLINTYLTSYKQAQTIKTSQTTTDWIQLSNLKVKYAKGSDQINSN